MTSLECEAYEQYAEAHRAEAIEAARFYLDTVKASAPIWKWATWPGGSDRNVYDHSVLDGPSAEAM